MATTLLQLADVAVVHTLLLAQPVGTSDNVRGS